MDFECENSPGKQPLPDRLAVDAKGGGECHRRQGGKAVGKCCCRARADRFASDGEPHTEVLAVDEDGIEALSQDDHPDRGRDLPRRIEEPDGQQHDEPDLPKVVPEPPDFSG